MGCANGRHHGGALAGTLQGDRIGERLSDYRRQGAATAIAAKSRIGWWYQYYFATERGRLGYSEHRNDFNKLIWKIVSPKWDNYRWRLGLAKGDPKYDDLESRLFRGPVIAVPTITIASDVDGAAADGSSYRNKFSGKYAHRVLKGIGHDVPQEDPQAFAQAVVDVDAF